jgi:hypothetical protein
MSRLELEMRLSPKELQTIQFTRTKPINLASFEEGLLRRDLAWKRHLTTLFSSKD